MPFWSAPVNIADMTAVWNAGGTTFYAMQMDVTDNASAAASMLLELQVNNVSKFKVDKAGILYSGYTGIYRSLRSVPDQNNVFVADAGNDNLGETGTGLTAVGALALSQATEASDCTAVGLRALRDIVDSIGCTAVGAWSQAKNLTTGITSVGDSSLRDNTTGQENNAFGYSCMIVSDTGSYNCAFGSFTLGDNRGGGYNSAFGDGAMRRNVSGVENVAVGYRAAYESLGNDQTAVGFEALRVATSGAGNTAVGSAAGWRTTTGANNVFLGHRAGDGSGGQLVTADNSIAIGYNAFTTKSNQAVVGNASVTETVLRGAIVRNELGADPADPAEGTYVTWMSNGAGAGDDGDIMVKITAGGVTKTATLIDFSALA